MIREKKENLIAKQPVIVLVGHIDHGKTSILDFIRKTHMAEKEVGGITQHIGAYEIERDGKKITFIDTPGHEAFSAMRARGAKVADIAILVVAADEGVKPQTKEAVLHIKKAQIPMIVAINKVDKPNILPGRIKDELSRHGVLVEERGGKIPSVEVSAKTGKGIADLLDLISLVTEMEDLKANISKQCQGVVIESYLDSKRGPTATLLLEKGVLSQKDIIGTPSCAGKIKRMEDFRGKKIEKALPGEPALVLGFEEVPVIGEEFRAFTDLETAREKIKKREIEIPSLISIEPGQKILNLILKTDVLGSIEPIEEVLKTLPRAAGIAPGDARQERIFLRILKKDAGDVSLSDIKLAETGKALILGFRVKTPASILEIAKRKNIKVLNFDLIYDLVEGMRSFIERILAPEVVRLDLGKLKTLVIFRTEKRRQIIGAKVLEGEIKKGVKIEVFRPTSPVPAKRGEEEEKIGEGKVVGLQKEKRDIEKGTKGDEVGILYEGDSKIQEGDILMVYEEKRQKVKL